MKTNIAFYKIIVLFVIIMTTYTRALSQTNILSEDFSSITTGDNTTTSGSGVIWSNGNSNFPTVTSAYMAGGAVKLGTASLVGSLTSKNLDLSVNGGAFKVKFKVKGWSTVEGSIRVTVTGLAAQTISYTAIYSSLYEQKELTFKGGTANSTVKIETTAKRAFIDDVVIYYENATSPILTVTPEALNTFTYNYGSVTPSVEQSFVLSGLNLTNNIIITAPSNYEISTTTGTAFAHKSPITLTQLGGVLASTKIYVRLKTGLATANYNENISISASGTTTKWVACSGSVVCVSPKLAFASATINKRVGNTAFTQAPTSLNTSPIFYSSNAPAYATVNATTGEVSVLTAGVAIISATQEANAQYCASTATYTLNISAAEPTILITEINNIDLTAHVGSLNTETITVSGINLTSDINFAITGANANQFSISKTSLAQTAGTAPSTVATITYAPTFQSAHNATLLLSGGKATPLAFTLKGTATFAALNAPVATAATDKTANGFIANWDVVAGAKSYDLDVFIKSAGAAIAKDLFISEYVEGLNSNKAIEIFNGTDASVNLAAYSLKKQSNAAGDYTNELVLSGTLAKNDVYILAYSASSASILAISDSNNATTASFNGNDAIALFKNGVKIDEVGVLYQLANWGADVTLIRKPTIISPKATYDASEWDTKAADYIADLGKHTITATALLKTSEAGYPITGIADNFKAVTGLTPSTNYYYSIIAKNPNVTSIDSNEILATTSNATAIWNATMNLSVISLNGKIMINAAGGEVVNIFNTIGQQLISQIAVGGINTIALNVKGVVIVKVGNRVAKVIL